MTRTVKRVPISLLAVCLWLMLSSCGSQDPIKIGFAGELTGKQLAIGARNGAQLAVEAINAEGGIDGRRLELVVEDDQGDPEIAKKVDAQLVAAGVSAIIGHITSSQTAAVLEQINEAKVVLLSPTATSSQFSHQQDYFFRVTNSSDVVGSALARYAYNSKGLRQVSGVYDTDNTAFSQTFWNAFVAQFEVLGGEVEQEFPYSSREKKLDTVAQNVLATDPSALVLVSSPFDTALLTQYLSPSDVDAERPMLLSSQWGQAEQLFAKGGQAVEGLVFVTTYDADNTNQPLQAFLQAFEERFGDEPDYRAVYGYEAVQVLTEALKQTRGQAEGLPEALTSIREFPVIQGNLSMNEYGDVERDVYIAVVEDGQYKIVETVSHNDLVMN